MPVPFAAHDVQRAGCDATFMEQQMRGGRDATSMAQQILARGLGCRAVD
jgi:hypothetical protein